MISTNVSISPSLLERLNPNKLERDVERLVDETSDDALDYVKEFGLGVGSVLKPYGGAPHWQGKITVQGHYSGYLSDTHYKKHVSSNNAQIVSSADFVQGVIEGFSTNWAGVRFGANNYHKRAVDKLLRTNIYGNKIQENWNNIRNNRGSW